MSDLISRIAVEQAIEEFNKKRVDKLPKGLNFEEHNRILGDILDENVEMLKAIQDLPTAYDVEKVVEQLEDRSTLSRPVGWSKSYELITLTDAIEIIRKGGKE